MNTTMHSGNTTPGSAENSGGQHGIPWRRPAGVAALILLIPFILTLLASWHWRPGALVLAFVLLFGGVGLTYGLVAKKMMSNRAFRFAVGVALAAVFLLVWMNAQGLRMNNSVNYRLYK